MATLVALAGCGDDGTPGELPPLADDEAPTLHSAALVAVEGGSARVELRVTDEGCGVASVDVLLAGDTIADLFLRPEMAPSEEDPDLWVAEISADRCGEAGELYFASVVTSDNAGNQRRFQETFNTQGLHSTDSNQEIAVTAVPFGAARRSVAIVGVDAVDGGIDVRLDRGDCDDPVSARAVVRSPGGSLLGVAPQDPGAEPLAFRLADPDGCLAHGAWTIDSLVVTTAGGGGHYLSYDDPGGPELPPFSLRSSTGDGPRPLEVGELAVTPVRGVAGHVLEVTVTAGAVGPTCPITSWSGNLRRLPGRLGLRQVARFSSREPALLSECAPSGRWWVWQLSVRDTAGRTARYRLDEARPEAGFDELPQVEPAWVDLSAP